MSKWVSIFSGKKQSHGQYLKYNNGLITKQSTQQAINVQNTCQIITMMCPSCTHDLSDGWYSSSFMSYHTHTKICIVTLSVYYPHIHQTLNITSKLKIITHKYNKRYLRDHGNFLTRQSHMLWLVIVSCVLCYFNSLLTVTNS